MCDIIPVRWVYAQWNFFSGVRPPLLNGSVAESRDTSLKDALEIPSNRVFMCFSYTAINCATSCPFLSAGMPSAKLFSATAASVSKLFRNRSACATPIRRLNTNCTSFPFTPGSRSLSNTKMSPSSKSACFSFGPFPPSKYPCSASLTTKHSTQSVRKRCRRSESIPRKSFKKSIVVWKSSTSRPNSLAPITPKLNFWSSLLKNVFTCTQNFTKKKLNGYSVKTASVVLSRCAHKVTIQQRQNDVENGCLNEAVRVVEKPDRGGEKREIELSLVRAPGCRRFAEGRSRSAD